MRQTRILDNARNVASLHAALRAAQLASGPPGCPHGADRPKNATYPSFPARLTHDSADKCPKFVHRPPFVLFVDCLSATYAAKVLVGKRRKTETTFLRRAFSHRLTVKHR